MRLHSQYVHFADAPPELLREETGDAVALKGNDEQIVSARMFPATADQTVLETDRTSAVEATGHLAAQRYAADEIAAQLIANGYRPVPINRGEKGPKIARWQERTFRPDDFLPSSNIGILTGHGVALLDIDVTDKEKVDAIVKEFIDRFEDRGRAKHETCSGEGAFMQEASPGHARIIQGGQIFHRPVSSNLLYLE